ncbi:hypothetical protein SB394_02595 [Burkholderia sp. BCCIQ04A]|uniref:Uncharacterized protein n=1 Tax=Burkholderia anthinoferrum TaxID=3090833 RepID=A0ABU5WUU2_9BURK|nr:hypothetical protein [Burkholderia anthinoferrum]MEB2535854.1 hypothetical protein [Burkholderia anthinoferrum]MEB2561982.1 hypothetical protein [Burkholderia anthinoferrum]MEB2582283.1 hypothetical protein [Burkholderia anthinoferrum]MEB2632608.1 hypothetical protein [Burkholderia anthinoferrum]
MNTVKNRSHALTDAQILEIGYKHFKPGHNVEAETNFVATVRDVLAASAVEQPGSITAQIALAAIKTFEIVGESNDSREPNDEDRFILTEFIAHAFGGFRVEQPSGAPTMQYRLHGIARVDLELVEREARAFAPTAQAHARVGLTDEQRKALNVALKWVPSSVHTVQEALRPLLAAHPDRPERSASAGVIAAARAVIEADRARTLTTEHVNALDNTIKIQHGELTLPEPRAEVTDDDKLCASRYRWLSRQVVAAHSRDDLSCRWEVDYVLYGESFDAAIDAARAGDSQ